MRPQPGVLAVWRLFLTAAALVPALLCSLFLGVGSALWWVGTLLWMLLFLGVYLFYLPLRYNSLYFSLGQDKITLHSGVFRKCVDSMPLQSIQFTTVISNPVGRIFGLCSLMIVAPGGHIIIPGLRPEDAGSLASLLPEQRCAE